MSTQFLTLTLSILLSISCFAETHFPDHWWSPVEGDKPSWEITPDQAIKGKQLILSKRNELGVFSNLGAAKFEYDKSTYASVEALWQLMKYPDPDDKDDPRHNFSGYPYSRNQVKDLAGFPCKRAGDAANEINKANGIKWVSYKGVRFNYKDMSTGSAKHFKIIRAAIRAKVLQNPGVKKLLLSTGHLELLPDHKIKPSKPQSYFYNKILMNLRTELQQGSK